MDFYMKKTLITLTALLSALSASADVKLTRLFDDNMILQQKQKNSIWGWADANSIVNVKASWGSSASTKADATGKWKVFLDTPGHGTGFSLSISDGDDTKNIKNVAIGEVWLVAGQSNCGWSVGNCFGGEEDVADDNYPDIRIFRSAREHWHEPLEEKRDRLSHWTGCTPETAAATSAVGYWALRRVHKELGIPVGIIQQAFAGTPIEGWMPTEIQLDDPRMIAGKESMDELSKKRISKADALKAWQKELDLYNKKIDAGETMKNKVKPLAPPIITKPSNMGHQYPAHIFNAMIHPVRPYGIKGMIWYQGERNSKTAQQAVNYRKQLAKMIDYYRTSWNELSGGNNDKNFPFFFTQLPAWHPAQTTPVEGIKATWAVNREMMRLASYDIPNSGMAVSIDTGDATALHPKNKKPIGIRHAYLILKNVYGKNYVANGPRYQKQSINGNEIILEFDSIGSGMVTAKSGKLNAFAIAGDNQKWEWAEAKIVGSSIVVSSPKVSKPVAVRYAWAMNPSERNLLYNNEGLPASPFRTDNWELHPTGVDINSEIRVDKPAKPETKSEKDWDRPVMTQ
jgi:sialate O-acetylesterase